MEVKDLLFFNKEGHQMNMNYDETLDLWNGKMFFDKNSTETFKTQGIYTFEKVPGSNNTFQAYLDKFQVFNTNNFLAFPLFGATELEISDIKTSTDSPLYQTKWIYAEGIEKNYYPGMWVYFKGLNGYHNTDFDELSGGFVQARKIFAVEPGRILVFTTTANNVPLAAFVPGSTIKIVPMNVFEVQQALSGLPPEPTWNDINLDTMVYDGKKLSIVANSDNSGIYTHLAPVMKRTREAVILSPTAFTPSAGDKLIITLTLNVSNIPISNGVTQFGITNTNEIQPPYIPSYLKVGDYIQAFQKTVPLSILNAVSLLVTGIDKATNTITVATALNSQSVDCIIDLATNVVVMEQDVVLDNNNVYSLPLTYWTMVNKWADILNSIPGGGILQYLPDTDELLYTSNFSDSYSTITAQILDTTLTLFPLTVNAITYDVFPLWLKEPLKVEERVVKNSTVYNRDIVFTVIDDFGLNVNINGVDYNVDRDFIPGFPILTVSNTIGDFISEYAAILATIGITVSQTTTVNAGDTLNITCDYPNIPVFTQLRMGDFSQYAVKYRAIQFNNIKSQFIVTINEQNFYIPYNTSDAVTVTNWVNTHAGTLSTLGIFVSNTGNTLIFDTHDPEKTIQITYNIGYIPKSGDLSVYEFLYATNSTGDVIAGNEIKTIPGTYNFFDLYSTGQKISITGALKLPQNKSYNIIGLESDTLSLSYQGAFWQQGLPVFSLQVISDYFIRFPKYGLSDYANNAKLVWSWKDTQNAQFFYYDFTGNQLKPIYENFPEYAGIKPLCGPNGEIELKLLSKPNDKLELIEDPTKQQTVFDKIEYTIPYIDNNDTAGLEPEPMQLFMGYRADFEGWNKARTYLELIEDVSFNLTTSTNMTDDLWVFKGKSLEVQSPTVPFDFNVLGFKKGQRVQIDFLDVNVDGRKIATLNNGGKKYKIDTVAPHKLTFVIDVLEETSIKEIPKTTPPFYDNTGNPLTEIRTLNVSLSVVPKVIAYMDMYGESEEEDERHKISLNNKNLNILKLQDFYIFKEVDIKEQGIDWIILNRKRKELLEIYPELFNNLASYKSVILAINFFGYNDLSFTEYFQNINPESTKFGQLFNMELLNIFDKSVPGWEYSNLAFENLRNEGFRKTNLFSLNYKITDNDGNFISAYSLEEVRIKLLGLKKWLTENIIPLGTKIIDITGKYRMPQQFVLKHETYNIKNFRVEEYATPVDFKVTGYLAPVSNGSFTYNISTQFFSAGNIEWFEYKIRTFYLEEWNETINYVVNDTVYHNGITWKCVSPVLAGDEPGITSSWTQVSIYSLPANQILKDYRYDDTGTSFTCNKLIDPHFIVEVSWHSGYGSTLLNRKVYSVIPDFFKNINP
jgi:hypothetical protein